MRPVVWLIAAVLFAGAANLNAQDSTGAKAPKITFLEIGSVNCIPCKKMQPIIKNIARKYGSQIKVIFHNVREDEEVAEKYGVDVIPTQIFLDAKGKEIHRHIGYYPEKDIDKFLKKRGLKPKS